MKISLTSPLANLATLSCKTVDILGDLVLASEDLFSLFIFEFNFNEISVSTLVIN
jgi:hypothetical protein